MNIWLISKYASPPKYAKAPARLFYLGKEMKALGNKVLLITSDSNHFSNFPKTNNIYNDETEDGVNIRWIKTKKYKKTASINRIISWFDFELKLFSMKIKQLDRPDVIIVSSLSILSIVYGYYLKKKFNSFLVFEIRDIWPLTMTEEGGFSTRHPLVKFIGMIEKFGYKKSDLIVGTMPNLNAHVKNILGYDKPFFCSPMGFNPEKYAVDIREDSSLFEKYIQKNKIIVGYAGSIGITNALETFIDTIKLMRDNSNLYFLIAGSGDLKQIYEEQLNGQNNVSFLPRIDQDQVKSFLSICDILYLSTKDSKVWKFGQSMNKVVEYMLAGKPIVATYTGFPSMINEANCGLFVQSDKPEDLKNVFLYFANMSEEERLKIGENGRNWIYQYRTYDKLAKEYINTINNLMKNR
jgi:glycosyltransferase involved in cell wall biosynthesis